jgi:gamma-glutamylcyclotransferase (GGCT)/AIG2-like uncharacterized protein YtfP
MSSASIYMFAYGMNTNPEAMTQRVGSTLALGHARLQDHRFRFARYADVYPSVGDEAHGVLWRIDAKGLQALDLREGYPYCYNRKEVQVDCEGQKVQALMYYLNPGRDLEPPPSDYVAMIREGYSVFGVPLDQVRRALREVREDMDKNSLQYLSEWV